MAKKNESLTEEMVKRVEHIISNLTRAELAKTYAKYSNQLKVEAVLDEDEKVFLETTTKVLEEFIIQEYMIEQGFYCSAEDEYNLWEKVRT